MKPRVSDPAQYKYSSKVVRGDYVMPGSAVISVELEPVLNTMEVFLSSEFWQEYQLMHYSVILALYRPDIVPSDSKMPPPIHCETDCSAVTL